MIAGSTHGFPEIATPQQEKQTRKKRKAIDDNDVAFQQSMMTTLDALSTSLMNKNKKSSEPEAQVSKASDPVYEELLQYCTNFARRMADIPDEESRERIRHAMEMAMFEHKFKK